MKRNQRSRPRLVVCVYGIFIFVIIALFLLLLSFISLSFSNPKNINEGIVTITDIKTRFDIGYYLTNTLKTTGVEIGVDMAEYSDDLLSKWSTVNSYSMIDPWSSIHVDKREPFALHKARSVGEKYSNEKKGKTIKVIRSYSLDAIESFSDESLDFIFFDAEKTAIFVENNLMEWSKKIKVDGIIVLRDYLLGKEKKDGDVQRGVDEFLYAWSEGGASRDEYSWEKYVLWDDIPNPSVVLVRCW